MKRWKADRWIILFMGKDMKNKMNKEERIRQLASDMDYSCTKQDLYPDDAKEIAKALDILGYRKVVWHKVADGDLPENDSLVIAFYKPGYYGTKLYLKNADGEGWWYGTSKCKTDEIIAWTELPTYNE